MSGVDDAALARQIADAAGKLLLTLRDTGMFEGKALGNAGDRVANAMILEALAKERPEDFVLSEESADDKARCQQARVWIVDPLDGTREYSEGRTDWAVHVALTIGCEPVIGAVALPSLELTLGSDSPPPLQPAHAPLRMLVSRTRPAAEAVAVAEKLGAELLPMGSAGAKAMAVVRGEADIYLHTGGQYEWDSCAPVAVAAAAGLHVSRVDGSPLVYNCENPYMPDLLICSRELAPRVLELVAEVAAAAG
ncbi:3'(2'),5'-bisphosphate nucleotidase CysQ [Sphingomonas sp.]|uniref:3'(2'),5'-bisphosphate nucleotidase CysQ n=1 Tax=Sphingomonas sp. TaxID=28214 RepID=UPI001AFEFB19|nr:3'(2'),5'-bisphosphate nucleotidase CysQ [Sphingomonas sp.]MBO9715000.1 3'(2'),5'-bisphosphate nucleotidase CysQ [Sphingomonas sp.]